jgi:hypothetical protein
MKAKTGKGKFKKHEQTKNQTTTAQRFLCARNCRRVIDVAESSSPTATGKRKHC